MPSFETHPVLSCELTPGMTVLFSSGHTASVLACRESVRGIRLDLDDGTELYMAPECPMDVVTGEQTASARQAGRIAKAALTLFFILIAIGAALLAGA